MVNMLRLLDGNRLYRDLGLLKRDKTLQLRYNEWAKGIKKEHGSIGAFDEYAHYVHTSTPVYFQLAIC